MILEHKQIASAQFTVLEAKDGEPRQMKFSGYGAVFGNVDSYGDVIDPGAFQKSLAEAKQKGIFPSMLMQHGGWGVTAQDMMPIGVWDTLAEDGTGLVSDGILAETPRGVEAYTLLSMKPRPAITGLSIGYIPKKFTMRSKADEPRRRLHEVDLMEISLVTFPANTLARVSSVKSASEFDEKNFEQLMQQVGLSRKEARIVLNHGFRHLMTLRSAGDESSELAEIRALVQSNINLLKA